MEWQPIETAPTDGTNIIAECFEDFSQQIYRHSEIDYGDVEVYQIWKSAVTGKFVIPTRWIPLPPAGA